MGLSVGRWFDGRLLLLSGTADDPALDGYAPTVVSDFDANVLFSDYWRKEVRGCVEGRCTNKQYIKQQRSVDKVEAPNES